MAVLTDDPRHVVVVHLEPGRRHVYLEPGRRRHLLSLRLKLEQDLFTHLDRLPEERCGS